MCELFGGPIGLKVQSFTGLAMSIEVLFTNSTDTTVFMSFYNGAWSAGFSQSGDFGRSDHFTKAGT